MKQSIDKMIVSIIIPTYNSEKTIRQTLNSIFNQVGLNIEFNIEVFICDDLSTDNTINICNEYSVIILKNEKHTGGPNAGRNNGLKHANGIYVCFLDHDDEWVHNKLKLQLNIDADVVYSQYLGGEKRESDNLYNTLIKRDNQRGWLYMGSLLIKNNNIPLFEEYFGQLDFDWLLKLTKDRKCIQCSPVVKRNITGYNLSFDPIYRKRDFYMGLLLIEDNPSIIKKWYASRGRYYYVIGNMKMARFYFSRGSINWKTILYYISSYNIKFSKAIVKKFKVFG